MLYLLFLLVFLITGCGPRIVRGHFLVIRETPTYSVGQERSADGILDSTHFVIHAIDAKTAQKAAEDELGCKKRVCLMSPNGVILMVERPE